MFGSGPAGVLTTILLWVLALQISTWINIPEMKIAPTFRWILIVLFSIDAVVLLLWSHIILPPLARAKTLITTGPYQYVRHPIYLSNILLNLLVDKLIIFNNSLYSFALYFNCVLNFN